LLSSWVDYIKSVSDILYTEGTSKLGYIKDTNEGVYIEGTCGRVYTRNRNKVIYIEFAGCCRLVYTPSKINIGW
jgi:hypothetical protein